MVGTNLDHAKTTNDHVQGQAKISGEELPTLRETGFGALYRKVMHGRGLKLILLLNY